MLHNKILQHSVDFNNLLLLICSQHLSMLWGGGFGCRLQTALRLLPGPGPLHTSLQFFWELYYLGMFFSWPQIAHGLTGIPDASSLGFELTDILLFLPIPYLSTGHAAESHESGWKRKSDGKEHPPCPKRSSVICWIIWTVTFSDSLLIQFALFYH